MVVKDVIKQICEASGFSHNSEAANAIHHAVTSVYGSEYKQVNSDSALRYRGQVEKKLYAHNSTVANIAVRHVRDVMGNLK
ncbi:MAG: hypothetical protein WD512_11185 [Candidatus Paceibacterota bacterium]